jgi:creatinine amidohydrolase/Fe(II)-dependent formamide hydrolase-like protein
VLVPTGGIEQNGPFVSLSKHNYIARAVSLRAAELLGSTLVAPVVPFVPQGNIKPPTGHMLFSGTISLKEKTFEALLEDIGASLAVHGFTEIVFLGDSAGNQRGMQKAAAQINKRFHQSPTRAFYIPEFYNYPELRKFLAQRGIEEQPEDFHEELAFSLQLLAISPPTLRYEQRIAAGHTTLGGLSLLDRDKLVALGKEIIEMRAQSSVKAIRERELMPERK